MIDPGTLAPSTPPNAPAARAAGVPGSDELFGRRAETSLLGSVWRRFRRHRLALVGAIMMIMIVIIVAAAPITARYSPTEQNLRNRL
jgi:peptide/nickel transport system permease protein